MNLTWQQRVRECIERSEKAEERVQHLEGVVTALTERLDAIEGEHNRRKGGRPRKGAPGEEATASA